MDSNQSPMLMHLPSVETPANLLERVMCAVERLRVKRLRVRLALVTSGFIASVGFAAVNWSAIWNELGGSSVVEFLRIAASDPDIVFSNVQDFAFGIAETVPLMSVLLALLVAFFAVGIAAFANAWCDLRRTHPSHHHLTLT